MDKQGEGEGVGREPLPGEEQALEREARLPRKERKRRKVSWLAALIVNIVTIIVVAIMLLVFLMPGYRRSHTMGRALNGAEEVWVVVKTTEEQMRANGTDFIPAQDSLKNAMQELVKPGGDSTFAFVRDSYPDQGWTSQYLPQDMQQWLQQLYPQSSTPASGTELHVDTAAP
jgi:hypothetical protein